MDKVNKFSIFHFNDVYEIEGSTVEPVGGAARFVTVCKQFKKEKGDQGLILFSGDLFSPSTLSVLYKGEQMIEPINACGVDVACVGNHEFDYPLEEIESRFRRCNFPWLCSNIFNIKTNNILANNHAYFIEERAGIRIGIIGLAEGDWLNTITEIDMSIVRYEDFVKCANQLIDVLKNDHDCEMIIALTHMRVPNDKLLAEKCPGIDLVLGGHDHIVINELVNQSLFIKSGTDFKDYGILDIEVGNFESINQEQRVELMKEKTYILKNKFKVNLHFHQVTKEIEEDPEIKQHVEYYIEKSREEMMKVIGFTFEPLDTRFSVLRTQETNFGNFYADVVRKEVQADVAIINSGTIRSDCIFPEGEVNYSLLNKALPFPDIIVVQELTGAHILEALENGVSKWPSYDGRFPLISGISFTFDGRKPPGERVLRDEVYIGNQKIDVEKKYSSATKQFVSLGKDGYDVFHGRRYILDFENGLPHLQIMISFFKSLENKDRLKGSGSVSNSLKEIQNISLQQQDSNDELPPMSTQPQIIRRSSSIISQNTPSIQNIKVMRSIKRRQSRIEKIDDSGLVAGIKVHDDQTYIVIAPKCDGRIKILQ